MTIIRYLSWVQTRAGIAPRKCQTAKGIRLKDHDTVSGINTALDRRYLKGAAIDTQLEYLTTKVGHGRTQYTGS